MIGVGFVGTGGVAERHTEALAEIRDARLVSAWSRTPENVRAFAERHGCEAAPGLDVLLADDRIRAVLVLSSAEAHVDHAIRALEAGKHVLVEKPVGETVAEIERLQAATARSGRVCMPSHNYIYAPDVRRLRHHLRAGRLGRLQSFWMLCNQRQTQALGRPGVVLNDMMVHLAYASVFFCGAPERLVAVASNVYFDSGADDQVGLTLAYADGAIATLWASWANEDRSRDPWTATIKVHGSEGTGVASWDNVKNATEPQPGWDDGAYWDSFLWTQRHFVEDCLGRGDPPLSTLADARTAARIVEAAGASLEQRRWVTLGSDHPPDRASEPEQEA